MGPRCTSSSGLALGTSCLCLSCPRVRAGSRTQQGWSNAPGTSKLSSRWGQRQPLHHADRRTAGAAALIVLQHTLSRVPQASCHACQGARRCCSPCTQQPRARPPSCTSRGLDHHEGRGSGAGQLVDLCALGLHSAQRRLLTAQPNTSAASHWGRIQPSSACQLHGQGCPQSAATSRLKCISWPAGRAGCVACGGDPRLHPVPRP